MFRPYAVNPWLVLNQMAQSDGKTFSIGYIRRVVQQEGWRMLGLNVLPLMVANGMVGVALFHSYTLASWKTSNHFFGGGIAGMISTIIATPMDRVTQMMTTHVMQHRHIGVHQAAYKACKTLPRGFLARMTYLYRGIAFNSIRYFLVTLEIRLGLECFLVFSKHYNGLGRRVLLNIGIIHVKHRNLDLTGLRLSLLPMVSSLFCLERLVVVLINLLPTL
jgi:hypothetical protein